MKSGIDSLINKTKTQGVKLKEKGTETFNGLNKMQKNIATVVVVVLVLVMVSGIMDIASGGVRQLEREIRRLEKQEEKAWNSYEGERFLANRSNNINTIVARSGVSQSSYQEAARLRTEIRVLKGRLERLKAKQNK